MDIDYTNLPLHSPKFPYCFQPHHHPGGSVLPSLLLKILRVQLVVLCTQVSPITVL